MTIKIIITNRCSVFQIV